MGAEDEVEKREGTRFRGARRSGKAHPGAAARNATRKNLLAKVCHVIPRGLHSLLFLFTILNTSLIYNGQFSFRRRRRRLFAVNFCPGKLDVPAPRAPAEPDEKMGGGGGLSGGGDESRRK